MIKRYGIFGSVYLAICLVRSKFVFGNARLIRFPIDLRNKKAIKVGKGFTTGRGCRLEVEGEITNKPKLLIGENFQMNDYCHITAAESVIIGDNVLLASKVYISDVSHGKYGGNGQSAPSKLPVDRKLNANPVVIEDSVWLGDGVCVLPGVTIGECAVIGANAVVTTSIPANTIAVGIPARPIKKYNFESKEWERI